MDEERQKHRLYREKLYDTPVKRLLRACGLALVNQHLPGWYITNPAWKRLQKWEEEHGNDI